MLVEADKLIKIIIIGAIPKPEWIAPYIMKLVNSLEVSRYRDIITNTITDLYHG